MAQYKSFEPYIQTGGTEIVAIAFGIISNVKQKALAEKYRLDTRFDSWNDLQSLLDALEEIATTIGEMNLLAIGKGAAARSRFPSIGGLKNALESIDIAYHMNHRKNGKLMFDPITGTMLEGIGHYELTFYDEETKRAEMRCHTPYPTKLEEGIIYEIVRKFRPQGSLLHKVMLDTSKEMKDRGGESSTFSISW